ncbi:hypothetical protein [Piscinibacter gummiphilus]|uniref:Uncharacterized protein n=1 Tax=Piscinibacter gummiphilus TaxID=946333 RepID=A0ABZ0D6G3_9BURK|nr:hypothetical protein [Piscinibacter gummiphilus]WOB11111.1 hypothetical protein RXV79_27110 [Piscinibacter gummiphilus]
MTFNLRRLVQPFDQSGDPDKPRWYHSWWFGGLLVAAVILCLLTFLSAAFFERRELMPLAATGAMLHLAISAVEWAAGLRRQACNTLYLATLFVMTASAALYA